MKTTLALALTLSLTALTAQAQRPTINRPIPIKNLPGVVPAPNLGFESGATGWTGSTECIVDYTDPAPALPAAAQSGLQAVGGSYWKNIPSGKPLPVVGLRCVDTSVSRGTTAQLTSQPFLLLAPGEADPLPPPGPIKVIDKPILIPDKLPTVGGLRRNVPTPLAIQFLRQSLNNTSDGNLIIEFQVRPRNAEQKQVLDKMMTFQLPNNRPIPGQPPIAGGTQSNQVPDWTPATDGSGFYRRAGLKFFNSGGPLQRIVWDITALRGMEGRILISDSSTNNGLFVDDFQLTPNITPLPTPAAAGPVWGFADLHAHPAAHLGFGGKLYHGSPEGPINSALDNCEADHGFMGSGLAGRQFPATILQAVRAAGIIFGRADFSSLIDGKPMNQQNIEAAIDGLTAINDSTISQMATLALGPHFHSNEGIATGAPGWYSHQDQIHQHMHVDYIRRAWQGGLRLMVSLAVSNELLGNMNPKPGVSTKDKDTTDRQLQYMKDMAARNSSWMEIAYTPADARRIIGQNKLALVLGVEVDSLGGFGKEGECTDAQVEAELNRLKTMGARHFFPIHLADNAFGGTAFYSDLFLLNHLTLRGAPHRIDSGDSSIDYKPFEGIYSMVPPGLLNVAAARLERNGRASIALNGGLRVPFAAAFRDMEAKRLLPPGAFNSQGLTARGQFAIQKMMDLGLIIDIDHMSGHSTVATLGLAEARTANGVTGYPVVSGHTHFRPLSWRRNETSDPHKYPTEADKTDSYVNRIQKLGGMVAPITGMHDVRQSGTQIANNAPGTSKSWAQSYLYAISRMGDRNVGLASDMPMYGGLGPRFGPRSLPLLADDQRRAQSLGGPVARRTQQALQSNAVAYTSPLSDWKTWRWDGDGWTEIERDALQAVMLYRNGPPNLTTIESQIQPARGIIDTALGEIANVVSLDPPRKRIMNMTLGLRANAPIGYVLDVFNLTVVQNAAYDARRLMGNGTVIPDPNTAFLGTWGTLKARHNILNDTDKGIYKDCFNAVCVALATLNRMPVGASGTALTRPTFGGRQFDFNLDGLAHYGMLPDMLQDLANNGANPNVMAPLFRSAEDYIRLWEKCEKLKKP